MSAQAPPQDPSKAPPPGYYDQAPPVQGYGAVQQPPPAATVHVQMPAQPPITPQFGVNPNLMNQQRTYFGETGVYLKCPSCQQQVTTKTGYQVGLLTWMLFGLLFLMFFTWLCCWIPFVVPACKDVVHTCPNCKTELGRMKRLS